jgi:hypothetical protein
MDKMDLKNGAPPPYQSNQNGNIKLFENRLKIIVGLDYGTTNSGKAIAYLGVTKLMLCQESAM